MSWILVLLLPDIQMQQLASHNATSVYPYYITVHNDDSYQYYVMVYRINFYLKNMKTKISGTSLCPGQKEGRDYYEIVKHLSYWEQIKLIQTDQMFTLWYPWKLLILFLKIPSFNCMWTAMRSTQTHSKICSIQLLYQGPISHILRYIDILSFSMATLTLSIFYFYF